MILTRKNEASWCEDRKHWRLDIQVDGHRKSFYSPLPGRKGRIECGLKADEWIETHGGKANANPRLCELWADFLLEKEHTTGPSNYRTLESLGRVYILPKLGNQRICAIKIQNWQDVITAAYQRGLARKTCANIRGAVTALYGYARKNRIDMERPEFITIPRDAPVGERRILQPDQLRTLFNTDWIVHWGRQEKCFSIHAWRFVVLSGLRRGELCGLRWRDLSDNILHITRSVTSHLEITRGKNDNARRYIALSPRMMEEIAEQRAMLHQQGITSEWIFPDEAGSLIHPNNLYRQWYVYCKQHGISSSIHELRHTMISLVKSDIPEALLKQVVGHSEAMDTGIYQHVVDGDADRAAQMIDNVFGRILEP